MHPIDGCAFVCQRRLFTLLDKGSEAFAILDKWNLLELVKIDLDFVPQNILKIVQLLIMIVGNIDV